MIYVTRKAHFNAAHKLYNPKWDAATNEAVFGKCANMNWHGHNFELFVTVKGLPDPETGFVIDLKLLKNIVNTNVIEKLDHKNLNLDVDFMQGKMASTETLIVEIWKQLAPVLDTQTYQLHALKLYETQNNYAEYFGE